MTAMHISNIIIRGQQRTSLATAGTSKTLIVSTMIVVMVVMNNLGFGLRLVALTGFVICRVIGIHLIGSVVSCFLVHKELLVGP